MGGSLQGPIQWPCVDHEPLHHFTPPYAGSYMHKSVIM
jgi:hypothetical protein